MYFRVLGYLRSKGISYPKQVAAGSAEIPKVVEYDGTLNDDPYIPDMSIFIAHKV